MNELKGDWANITRLLATVVSALCLSVLIPINGWALYKLVDLGERMAKIETWQGGQASYTPIEAARDMATALESIRSNRIILGTHNDRLNRLEKQQ